MVKVAVRGGCVCVGGWWEGWCDVIFNITEGVRTNFFLFWRGVLSKFLLDNSSFSVPPPPLIIIAQSLRRVRQRVQDFRSTK